MGSDFEIRTLTGVRLDVDPTATIEINMGGLSLLNLESRTATYTNSFKLPRTATNEAIFGHASQPTRNNRPKVDVIVRAGFLELRGVITVISSNKEYNTTFAVDNGFVDYARSVTLDAILPTTTIVSPTPLSVVDSISIMKAQDTYFPYFMAYGDIATIASNVNNNTNNIIKKIPSMLPTTRGGFLNGYIFSGQILSDLNFQKMAVVLTGRGFEVQVSGFNTYFVKAIKLRNSEISYFDFLKGLSQIFAFDYKEQVGTKTVKLTSLKEYFAQSGIKIEGFSYEKKTIEGLGKVSRINYDNEGVDKNFGGDTIAGHKDIPEKEVLKSIAKIPITVGSNYKTSENNIFGKLCFFDYSGTIQTNTTINDNVTISDLATLRKLAPISLSGFYSSILNPIFANPVIIEASRVIDPLTANNIMNQRVINSVQLGGRYWVDSMAYNILSQETKMTLIKLPS